MQDKTLKQENTHLKGVVSKIKTSKTRLEESMKSLGISNLDTLKELRENPVASQADLLLYMQQLQEQNAAFNITDKLARLNEMEYLIKEPFFARIDLTQNDIHENIYIGKFGYTEEKPIVTDWRAKIASVYYRYRYPQKNVSYITPSGKITKDLELKRTFELDEGQIIKYYNNDLQLDESQIISDKIQKRTGGVLEDIVETIQEAQLDIIESDPRKICIVQGCVGSGKSTVAIHKLSHIFFNYQNLITPQRSILVAKSGILVSYLSTLFPKLGIFDINYKTLRELIVNLIFREDLNIKFDFELDCNISEFDLKKIKILEDKIQDIAKEYEQKIQEILSKKEFESFSSFIYSPSQSIQENITELVKDLEEELHFQTEKLKDNPNSVKAWVHKENIVSLKKLINRIKKVRIALKNKTLTDICINYEIDTKKSLNYLQSIVYVYLYNQLVGFSNTEKYQYCVIDEGQDLSPLEYLILGKLVMNGRFCILGDLNQSYLDEGLNTWDTIKEVISDAKNAQTFELSTNYRSTKQIIEFANNILSKYTNSYLPKSINRIGEFPIVKSVSNFNNIVLDLRNNLKEDLKNLDKSIGIICFNKKYFDTTSELLLEFIKTHAISADKFIKLDEKSRISYLPKGIYLTEFKNCKGLEFSKVYILGMSQNSVLNFTNAKKAFVAVTRAMNCVIIYDNKENKNNSA